MKRNNIVYLSKLIRMADKIENINKSVQKISELAKNLEKGDSYIDNLLEKLDLIEHKMLNILEEDERRKAQRKAS